jgi:nucleotide-binding universal stress UspA family protein
MNAERREQAIRRILVALDASPHSLAALAAAAELAASLRAELIGLYVEDETLLRLSGLPFIREYGAYTATFREVSLEHLEAQLRARASQARRALAMAGQQAHVRWTFRVVRGLVTPQVLAAAAEADLITLGRRGWSVPGRHLGSTARAVLTQTPGLSLVLEHGIRLGLPVVVIYDGSDQAQRALALGADFVRARGGKLSVLLLAGDPAEAEGLQADVASWLAGQGLQVRYRYVADSDTARLMRAVQAEGCGLVILTGPPNTLAEDGLLDHLHDIGCPALVVR